MIGKPVSDSRYEILSNLSSAFDESALQTVCWPSARTLTQKWPAAAILGQVVEARSGKNATSGGSSDTDVNDPTIIPTGPYSLDAVTAQTPVG